MNTTANLQDFKVPFRRWETTWDSETRRYIQGKELEHPYQMETMPQSGYTSGYTSAGVHLFDNEPFKAKLRLFRIDAGRHYDRAIFINDETGVQYSMFGSDFNDLVKKQYLWKHSLFIEGVWAFRLHSRRVGLIRLEDGEQP